MNNSKIEVAYKINKCLNYPLITYSKIIVVFQNLIAFSHKATLKT